MLLYYVQYYCTGKLQKVLTRFMEKTLLISRLFLQCDHIVANMHTVLEISKDK